jgi:phosphate transport system substrate-binding protein
MRTALALAAIALLAGSGTAQLPLPPRAAPPGLAIATSAELAPMLRRVAQAFEAGRPGAHVTIAAVGSDVAMADLYAGRADLAVLGRQAFEPEAKAYEWIYHHPPRATAVMRGSVATAGHSPAVAVLVNAANSVGSISLDQLRAAFRGAQAPRWGDLGARGRFAARPVHPIMPDSEQGTGRFLRHVLFADATLFAWDRVREVAEPLHRDGTADRNGGRIAAMVARDRDALALAPGPAIAGTRTIPIRVDGKDAAPDPQSVAESRYPLARSIYAYGDPHPSAEARAFLRFLLGPAGRQAIAAGPYLPLPAADAEAALKEID